MKEKLNETDNSFNYESHSSDLVEELLNNKNTALDCNDNDERLHRVLWMKQIVEYSIKHDSDIIDLTPKASEKSYFHCKEDKAFQKSKETDQLLKTKPDTTTKLRRYTLVLSWASLPVLGGLGLATLVIGLIYKSPSLFAFSLDALLDCISTAVIIWRFYSAASVYDYKKERIACVALGALFIVSAVSVIVRSSQAIHFDVKPSQSDVIWCIAIVDGVACLVLFCGYVYLAKRLRSPSLFTDSIITLIGLFLSVATLAGDMVYETHEHIWYLDPLLGLVCSGFLIIYGIVIIIYGVCCHESYQEEDIPEKP